MVLGQLELGAEEIDVLVERTEGWPAALVLAWLWLRTVEDPARAVRAFGGDNRFVADYLSGEVLAALDEDDRAFLHGAAVLGEFTAELCDAVLDRTDSAARLAELEHSNLFVSRLERGGWFRIHSLFAEYARAAARVARTGRADADSSASRRVAQIARVAGRGGRARGRSRRARARRAAPGRVPPAADQKRRRPDASALGSDAAGRPDRRASGACGGGRDGRDAGRRTHARAAPVARARRRGPWRATGTSGRLRRDGGAAGARGHDRRRRGAGGARRSACGRARGG